MIKIIEKKIERVNKLLNEIDPKEKDSVFSKGLDEGQKIAYTFMKSELEDLLWEYKREKQC